MLGEGNVPLKFDFAIIDPLGNVKALIEFQGEQHYEPIKFFGGEEKCQKQKRYDALKREYCKKHNLTLIEITYKDSVEERLKSLL